MTEAERNRIISNDYADFIVDYNHNYSLFRDLEDTTINTINNNYAIVHVPIKNFGVDSISKFGYYAIPSCYGLLSNIVGKDTAKDYSRNLNNIKNFKTSDSVVTTGAGVLIGFIDTGIDYTHAAFLNSENKTRIVSIWDQSIQSESTHLSALNYGTEYTREQIDSALKSPNPYEFVPSRDEIGHGTMLAGYAAGSLDPVNNFLGVAPKAELAVVKLKQAKPFIMDFFEIPQNANCYQENDIIMGARYLDELAKTLQKPLIICLGLGTSLGDHSGGRVISRYLSYIANRANRSVIIAGGNEGNRANHFYSNFIAPSNNEEVYLEVGEEEEGFSMQFLGISPNYFWIDLFAPGGVFLSRVPPVDNQTAVVMYENTTVNIDILLDIPFFYEQSIIFRFHNPEPGIWKLRVFGSTQELSMEYHFWLPMHNFLSDKTFFLKPDYYTTLTDPSNNQTLITTVAYDPNLITLEYNSGKGFTVNDDPKPDITAPGVNVICPFPGNQYVTGAGSSLSAGFSAGVAARVFEWSIVQGNFPEINHSIMKKAMVQSAYRLPELEYPNREWGYGIISLERIKVLLDRLTDIKTK